MNRRNFLNALGLGTAALGFDPGRLLWVPGAKTIFIPKPPMPERNRCFDLFTGTLGLCNGIPIPLSAVNLETMGPMFERQGNIYRIVELKDDAHVSWYNETIYAVPGGRLELLVRGNLSSVFSS